MDPCLRVLLTRTITIRRVTSRTSGKETLGAAATAPAYVERADARVGAAAGTERQSGTLVVTEREITFDDRIWLPGVDTGNLTLGKRPDDVRAFADPSDPSGATISHYEVTL